MIRVLHILWTAHFGGIEKLVYDLALVQSGDPSLKVAVLFGKAEGEFLEQFKQAGIECYAANLTWGADLNPCKIWCVKNILMKFDVLHVHTCVLPLAVAIAASGRGVLFTEHGNFGFGRKIGWTDYAKRPVYRWFVGRHVSYLSYNSHFTQRVWEERHPRLRPPRSVINNGILFSKVNGKTNGSRTGLETELGDSFIIGTTSRFAGFKRIDRLIRAFALFCGGRNTRLLLVGDGVLRKELVAQVCELGIERLTIFAGFRSDARSCQALMDVCVFASQNEPFGLVAVETLSLGKPTIVFEDGGGMAEIVGSVCPEDVVQNETALVQRLAHYYDHREEVTVKQAQRRDHAKRYDIQITAAEFKSIYDRISQP